MDVGKTGKGGLLKNPPCHSREGGNPDPRAETLDSRLRGNDRVEMRADDGASDAFFNSPTGPVFLGHVTLLRIA